MPTGTPHHVWVDGPGGGTPITATKLNEDEQDIANALAGTKAADINLQAASYTLVIGDAGKIIEMSSATANTLTVPTNATVPFPVGTTVGVVQVGAGTVTIAGAVGVTVRTASSQTTRAQWSSASLYKRGTDEWIVAGDLT